MPRNSSGTFTLAAGNPVVTGNIISSTWANTTFSDISSELTNSLDRSGRGPMLAALPLANGASGAPSLSFASEPATGLFRNAAADVQFQVGGTTVFQWIAAGPVGPLGLTLTQSQSNVAALTATGNGTAAAVSGTGGANNGPGLSGTGGGTSGPGVLGAGASSAAPGVKGIGGTNGAGLVGIGTGTGPGATVSNGTAATSTVRQDALGCANGDISFVGTAYPAATTTIVNRVTPSNVPKAWATLTTNGAGAVAISDGFNIASASIVGSLIQVNFAAAMANALYAVLLTEYGGPDLTARVFAASKTTALFQIEARYWNGGAYANRDYSTNATAVHVLVFGAQ